MSALMIVACASSLNKCCSARRSFNERKTSISLAKKLWAKNKLFNNPPPPPPREGVGEMTYNFRLYTCHSASGLPTLDKDGGLFAKEQNIFPPQAAPKGCGFFS